ncbi:fused response regulator/phosphatase [Marinomonas posidonica]|uniref:Response regulator receiver modulated protein serine/threonine phosphatase n=1 Tax=Marinomonas posidonica (strain CECT 7376 / NCIMB 14433 / IVIA-Po-181) TaxID=491952 RepID=F6CS80_MARPP|nr:fused response regulator/phosphatase [Marinomonas posidonica]AEF53867.1 response regulator receiver modulated protein serine/threonine phosphatase [Marinomonas posidonica IVIA-Po-181]
MEQILNILIADDNPSDRILLKAILSQFGHNVISAVDGQDAVEKFDPDTIQLVCLDVKMPRKDGWEAALEIQRAAGDLFVPIIFLSGVADPIALSNCLRIGGTDFISKPYSPALITAKLNAIVRLLVMQKTLEEQRDAMSLYNEQLVHDQNVAKVVYENITHSNCLKDPALSTVHYGTHTFNGDVILAAYKPNGGMHLLLGDFTGHGLSAAIGALPLADIFFDWTKKGFLMRQIIPEINARLKSILPANMFCSAAFIDIKVNNKSIDIWNGGLPDLLFFSQQSKVPVRFESKNLPLGILPPDVFECQIDPVTFVPGNRLVVFSDGVYEAQDKSGAMFCHSVLNPLYEGEIADDQALDWMVEQLTQEGVLENPHDDISCLSIRLDSNIGIESHDHGVPTSHHEAPADFSFEYVLNADSLRNTDPLPYVLQIITTVPGLSSFSSQVFMILSELYSNALEHGVLGLKSDKKSSSDGFSQYYDEREQRLAALKDGFVKISVKVTSSDNERVLALYVEDSGSGFDYQNVNFDMSSSELLYNRGLALLDQLCHKLEFCKGGRGVTAYYHWQVGQDD